MKKSNIIIIAVVVIVLVIIGVSKNTKQASAEPVRIGAALMLTGHTALLGELQQNGINLAV